MIKYTAHLIEPPYNITNELEKRQIIVVNYCPIESSRRIKDFHSQIEIKLKELEPCIEYVNLVIESQLSYLIFTNTIENLDNTKLTDHFKSRLLLLNNERPSLNFSKVEELSLSHKSIWLGYYGSLGYLSLDLNNIDLTYISFSELAYKTISLLFNRFSKVNFDSYGDFKLNNWNNNFDNILATSSNLEERYDFEVYNFPEQLFLSEEITSDTIRNLKFFTKWIPDLVKWYFGQFNNNYEVPLQPSEGTNEYKAYTILSRIARIIVNAGLDRMYDEREELSYHLLHQSLSTNWPGVYNEIINLRKQFLYDPNLSRSTDLDILATAFYQNIDSNSKSNLSITSSFILEYLTPPGGYNMLLISIACLLLNRAFIISHPSIVGNAISSTKFDELSSPKSSLNFPQQDLTFLITRNKVINDVLLRVNKLIFLAGATLRKSNLEHIILLGNNLCHISGFKDNSPVKIFQ